MDDTMKCPCCGGAMERGHLSANQDRILWTKKNRRFTAIDAGDDVVVQEIPLFGKLTNIAWRCLGCKRILVEPTQD